MQTREEATVFVKELDLFVTVMLLEETPAVLSVGKRCEDHGYTYRWSSGQKRHLTKKSKRTDCNFTNLVPLVVPCLLASSSIAPTPTSSSSSSQDSIFDESRYTENPVPERSGSMSEELWGKLQHKPTETENKNENEGHEEVQSDLLHDLPDWLQEFRENLVDESGPTKPRGNPAHKDQDTSSSPHELPTELRAKVVLGLGRHSVYKHFLKDTNCDICLKTKITRASCRRPAGTVMPRAENFGDLITADCEESESRNNHRYAVVLQDLATQWLQSYPCKTKTSQETQKSLMKFLEPTSNHKSFTLKIPENLAKPVRNYLGIIVRQRHTGQNQMGLQKEQCAE